MSLFRGKLICTKCGKKLKLQKRRVKEVFYCSSYNRNKNLCIKNRVDMERLIWFVSGHFRIEEDKITEEFIEENVKEVLCDGENNILIIHYSDGTQSIDSPTRLVR